MFERFTDRARKVMALANQEAMRRNHEFIGTEHILLGLVKEGSGVGANVLKNLGGDLHKIRLEVERLVKDGPPMVTMGKLPQTPRAKHVIEHAILEARGLNHNYVGTEHLLLGLLRETEGVAAQALMNLGVKLKAAREEVLNLLGAGKADDADRGSGVQSFEIPLDAGKETSRSPSLEKFICLLLDVFDSQITKLNREMHECVRQADVEGAAALREEIGSLHESKRAAIKKILGIE